MKEYNLTELMEKQIEKHLKNIDEEKFAKLEKNFLDISNKIIDEMGNILLKKILSNKKTFRQNKRMNKTFINNLKNIWGEPLDQLEIFIDLNSEIGSMFSSELSNTSLNRVLQDLNVKSIRTARAILCLLKNGFPDEANSLVRTLYETAVIGIFIEKYGKETAKRFEDYLTVELSKSQTCYNEYREHLGYEKIDTNKTNVEKDNLKQKYGDNFLKNYGWASHIISNPNFFKIEKNVDSKLRPYYMLSCENIHASSKNMKVTLGLIGYGNYAGQSKYGLADPAQMCMICLKISTVNLFGLEIEAKDEMLNILSIKILEKLFEKLSNEFVDIQKNMEETTIHQKPI